jgi:lactoylglutathione lyase
MRFTDMRLLVDDFDACLRFYRDRLQLPVRLEAGGGIYAEFDAGDAVLAIYRRDLMAEVIGAGGKQRQPGSDDVVAAFEVQSVDDSYEQLRARGIEFVTEPHDQEAWVRRVAHFRDPDGHLIEITMPIR